MDTELLERTARELVSAGRGILAADESNGTMSNRLQAVGVEPSPETRRAYRSNIFATPGYESAISGVILFDETIRQTMDDGTPIPEYLASRGVHPGIKVDTGAKELAHHSGEKITEGLDGLRERCAEYFAMGARFAKWRAVIRIGDSMPSEAPYIVLPGRGAVIVCRARQISPPMLMPSLDTQRFVRNKDWFQSSSLRF